MLGANKWNIGGVNYIGDEKFATQEIRAIISQ